MGNFYDSQGKYPIWRGLKYIRKASIIVAILSGDTGAHGSGQFTKQLAHRGNERIGIRAGCLGGFLE